MRAHARPLQRVIEQFERLPGIGPKSAQRLALYLTNLPAEEVEELGRAIIELPKAIRRCRQCFHLTETELCPICEDPGRDRRLLCVVEQPSDLLAIERAGEYHGLYHVLGGVLSPLKGIAPEDLHIAELMQRVAERPPAEVIIATSPTVEGDATATYLASLLTAQGIPVSRIALGLPVGSDLDYADQVTVARALRGRRPMEDYSDL